MNKPARTGSVRMAALLAVMLGLALGQLGAAGDGDLLDELQSRTVAVIRQARPSLVSVIRLRYDPETSGLLRSREGLVPSLPQSRMHPSFVDPNDPNFVPSDFGSGVIISADGLILTNYHVVNDYDELMVRGHDGKGYSASIWAADPRSDLAVLRIDASGLQPIRMAERIEPQPGQFVLAMGNPYATARDGRASAAFGIISNIARRPALPSESSETMLHHYGTLLQTDVRLNYGISGGALLNLNGEMIGLTTALAAVEGFDHAAGYAIPLDQTMRSILDILRQGREVEYGFLGINTGSVTEQQARQLGLETAQGVGVDTPFPGTPAAISGLANGDVILAVDGQPVDSPNQLIVMIGTKFAGTTVQLTIRRPGQTVVLPVTLAKFPLRSRVYASVRRKSWRGISVDYSSLLFFDSQQLANAPQGGALITEVQPGSPAAQAGLGPGAVITHVGQDQVHTPDEMLEIASQRSGTVVLTTDRGKFTIAQ